LRLAVPHAPEEKRHDLLALYRHHFIVQSEAIPLYDGARETIIELHNAGYCWLWRPARAVRAWKEALDSSGLKDYFHATRTAECDLFQTRSAMLLELMEELAVDTGAHADGGRYHARSADGAKCQG